MNPLTLLAILLGVFPLTAVGLVSLGQPLRPFGHLVKASAFWTIVVWVIVGAILWRVM